MCSISRAGREKAVETPHGHRLPTSLPRHLQVVSRSRRGGTHLARDTGGDDDEVSPREGALEAVLVLDVALGDGGGVDVANVGGDALDDGDDIEEGELGDGRVLRGGGGWTG